MGSPVTSSAVLVAQSAARARILEAFRLLMLERGYRRLTIRQVLERAHVGRTTFYAHFRSKDDLLAASVEGLGRSLARTSEAARATGCTDPLPFASAFLRHAVASRPMLAVLAEDSTRVVLETHVLRMLGQHVRAELAAGGHSHDDGLVQFVVGALWHTAQWYARQRCRAPDEVAAEFAARVKPLLGSEAR
jgi:AcrR family transcriptional regulator